MSSKPVIDTSKWSLVSPVHQPKHCVRLCIRKWRTRDLGHPRPNSSSLSFSYAQHLPSPRRKDKFSASNLFILSLGAPAGSNIEISIAPCSSTVEVTRRSRSLLAVSSSLLSKLLSTIEPYLYFLSSSYSRFLLNLAILQSARTRVSDARINLEACLKQIQTQKRIGMAQGLTIRRLGSTTHRDTKFR